MIGRAPGRDAAARRPERVAHARADLGAGNGGRADRGRRLEPRHVRRRHARDRAAAAARRRADPARRPGADRRAPARRRRGRAHDRRAPGRVARGRRGDGAPASAAQATQFGMRPRVRSGYALKRLDADGGLAPLGAARPRARRLPAAVRQRRAAVRAARRHALARRPDRRGRAALRRRPGRRASRGCSPTSASAGFLAGVAAREPAAEAPQSFWRRLITPREKVFTGRRARGSTRLYRRGGWVLFTRPALWLIGGALRGRRRRVRRADRAALRHAVRRREQDRARRARVPGSGASLVVAVHETAHGLDDGVVRPAGREGRVQADRDLPVRVRRHERGVVRAAPAADRDQRRRARCRTSPLGALFSICLPALPDGHGRATSSSSSRSPATSARSSTSTRSSSATATTCSSTGCASPGCGGARASSSRGGCRAAGAATTRRCSRATRSGASSGRARGRASRS